MTTATSWARPQTPTTSRTLYTTPLTAGDVVSSTGDVLGDTLPVGQEKQGDEKQEGQSEERDWHDEERSEYTTQPVKKKKSGGLSLGSLKGAVGGLTGAVGNTVGAADDTGKSTVGAVTSGLGIGGKSAETPQTPKQAEEVQDEMPEVGTEGQGGIGISLEGHDVPTDNKEAAETQDKLKPPRPLRRQRTRPPRRKMSPNPT